MLRDFYVLLFGIAEECFKDRLLCLLCFSKGFRRISYWH